MCVCFSDVIMPSDSYVFKTGIDLRSNLTSSVQAQVFIFSKFQMFKSNSEAAGQAAKVGAAADRTERYSASLLSYVADYGTEAGFTKACETPILLVTTHVSFRDQHQRDQHYMYV